MPTGPGDDWNAVRRYYLQCFADFMEKIVGYELLGEWLNERSVVQAVSGSSD